MELAQFYDAVETIDMTGPRSSFDRACFRVVGADPVSQHLPRDIAREERLLARSTSVLLVVILVIQFVATALSVYDIFIDSREFMSMPVYLGTVVFPVALVWTLILFGLFRFTGHAVYEQGRFGWRMLGRFLLSAPIWFVFPLMGFMAAIPFQTRIFLHDVQIESMIENWNRVAPRLIDLELRSLNGGGVDSDPFAPCLDPLIRFEVLINVGDSLQKIGRCEQLISNEHEASFDKEASGQALDILRAALASEGLIARSSKAFAAARLESWILAVPMMMLFFSPYLIRLMARRRAFEYVLSDLHRLTLARDYQIDLHAHDVFDSKGRALAVTRYRGFERIAQEQRQRFESEIEIERQRQDQARQAVMPNRAG